MALYAIDGKRPALPADGSAWIAPSADLIGEVVLGRDVGVWFGAVIRADNTAIVLGDGTNVQEGVMMHSDPGYPLTVGRGCTIGHHAILHGCTIGDDVLVGMGATVLNGATIGDGCLIGAGALVTEGKVFATGSLIVGAPARAVRTLPPEAIGRLRLSAAHYVARAKAYAAGLERIG
ncbi:gamma carbonic anhydrase family protein [Sphingomonas mollis]|uniref:Gamma carbonic anhydrase family protein n=1 Tax=Sphingomonas mollis TaxID=2795726 RepID=A0ABS0XL99_9SPHN|nr:gamma carbonic anhydrase family protein [Sphingomonas sp. BT553]MBJ6120806.1 gamma carbonic anhydrase family protein [Sphingomonas sp. BT553]